MLLFPTEFEAITTPVDSKIKMPVALVSHCAAETHGAYKLFEIVLLVTVPAAPNPICTPFCAIAVVEPIPVTVLFSIFALEPAAFAVIPFF
jgi:hypothetical protein